MSRRGLLLDDAAWASNWRRRTVADKALLGLGLLGCALVLPPWPGALLTGVVCLVGLLGPAAIPLRTVAACLRGPTAFILIGAASVLVSLSIDGGIRVQVTPQTQAAAASVLGRGFAATLAVFVIAATTPMVDVLAQLRRLRVPAPVVEVAALVYRILFVLLGTARAMREAQIARLGYADRRAAIRSMSTLLGAVVVRSWHHAQRLEAGLAGRGYETSLTTLDPPRLSSSRFRWATLTVVAGVCVVTLLVRLAPWGT